MITDINYYHDHDHNFYHHNQFELYSVICAYMTFLTSKKRTILDSIAVPLFTNRQHRQHQQLRRGALSGRFGREGA